MRAHLNTAGIYQRRAKALDKKKSAAKYREIKAWRMKAGRTVKDACEHFEIEVREYYHLASFDRTERTK